LTANKRLILASFSIKKTDIAMRNLILLILLMSGISVASIAQTYTYESVPGDPLQARIYTLANGLKVYMTVYKDEPRIQTYITVKVGSKNDPAETTGLAHYFEHMMFKGTPRFGTTDWEKEKVLIAEIERLFEQYRTLKDPAERLALYKIIDSVSYEASKLAIPNEYDKLMKAIGSRGTNAATSNDFTYYVENIPNNQLENWAMIQAERFSAPVLRLFHTELETVYEEKNMSLTNDGRRVFEVLMRGLYPNHPYGTQTTLGDQEHLKNPSMKNIREFYEKYYVPNNMAVIMSGDFDPDQAIRVVDKYLGQLKPGKVPTFTMKPEDEITAPKLVEITGLEAENIRVAYRFPGAGTQEALLGDMMSLMLSNGEAGLIDLNVNQKQRTLWASSFFSSMNDHSMFVLAGGNKKGQSLDEVKAILLEQIELLKQGSFPDWMLDAAINNLKLRELKRFESNGGRAMAMSQAFMRNTPWKDAVTYLDRLKNVTKADVVAFANTYLKDNYVVVYKRQGSPDDIIKVDKPPITPIHINRDVQSDFYQSIADNKVPVLKPVFLDYNKDITKLKTKKGQQILYKKNEENGTFNLVYYFPFGSDADKELNLAASYLEYLGTNKMSREQIGQEFYRLACSFSVSASRDQAIISLSGLSDNQEKAMKLLEDLLKNGKPNEEAWTNMVSDILKSREDAKANQQANFRALVDYATYGKESPEKHILSEAELRAIKPVDLVNRIKNLTSYAHEVIYYGPTEPADLIKMVEKNHKTPKTWTPAPKAKVFKIQDTKDNTLYFAHYEANQSYLQTVSKGGKYSEAILPKVNLYNAYFGGGMNTIVFQEMREKRGLAYTARSRYNTPDDPKDYYTNTSFIATQNDKIMDAFDAFNELFDDMPVSEKAFNLAKESMITDIETNRITKMNVIWNYIGARKMNRTLDIRKTMYREIPKMTLEDVKAFNAQYVAKQPKSYVILGNEKDMDFEKLEQKYGKVTKLDKATYFGY
jgi:predicted Zn-dependent peptidase